MNTYQVNKLIFAVLVAIGLAGVIRFAVDQFYPDEPAGDLAYEIDITEPAPATPSGQASEPTNTAASDAATGGAGEPASLAGLIAQSDPESGEKKAGICKACHSFAKGGPNMMGPNLWNVVGREKASVAGFSYSPALQSLSGDWSYEDLDAFLANPAKFATGTKMAYAGLPDPKDRAALIAYLRAQADTAAPLPAE